MHSSKLIELLRLLSPTQSVNMIDEIDGALLYVDQVYHEPPNTFLQGTAEEGRYSKVSALLERLEKIDASVPFDANIVFGDDWNYQEIKDVSERDGILVIQLSEPIFGSDE